METTHLTLLKQSKNDPGPNHEADNIDLNYQRHVHGDDALLTQQFSTHSKRGERLSLASIVSIILLILLALAYNIDAYLAANNVTTEVSIDITRETEMPVMILSFEHSTTQQFSTATINDIGIYFEFLSCGFWRDSDQTTYQLSFTMSQIIVNGTLIDNSTMSNHKYNGKYAFATGILNYTNISYAVYGYTANIVGSDTELTVIYYQTNEEIPLIGDMTLFQIIKNTYHNYKSKHINVMYIIDMCALSKIRGNSGSIWIIPILSDSAISKLILQDACTVGFDIYSQAAVENTTDQEILVNDLLKSQYYSYATIPLSQFIQDGCFSYYISENMILKNTFANVEYSTFSTENTITNKKIDSFNVDISTQAYSNAYEFLRDDVKKANHSFNIVGLTNNSFIEYWVKYRQMVMIGANIDGFDYRYVTKKIMNIWDVLGNTGGMFSIIKLVVIGIISFVTFGSDIPKWCQKCSKYLNRCCCWNKYCNINCDRCLEIVFGGIAPYQKYNKTDKAKLLRFLTENDYCTKNDHERQIQELKATVQELKAKLLEKD